MSVGGIELGTTGAALVLAGAALVLVTVGVQFTRLADELADRTGMGEAIAGALLLGATTSLPGLLTTILGAAAGEAGFAVSNAVGGIAAQTAFLALADLSYRRVNLEHAAVSVSNMVQSMVLVTLVGIVLAATGSPEVTVVGLHPATFLVVGIYAYGIALTRSAERRPMWQPEATVDTVEDVPDEDGSGRPLRQLWLLFAGAALVVAATGWAVGTAGLALAESSGMSGSLVGGLFTSVITSLPELVTVIVAVRIGALQMAVGNIIGGNTFDVLFVAAADLFFREGSVYHAADSSALFLLSLTVIMVAALAAGMLIRDRRAIGFEGLAILGFYGLGIASLVVLG